jgi:5-oxoprolinase (ATP-hydrolysing) subunit A
MRIDINCDMGESFGRYMLGDDTAMLDVITSANIACGLHAGDPLVMQRTVDQAVAKHVAVGAHPGYPDLQGFGRRAMGLSDAEIQAYLIYQIGALEAFAHANGTRLAHVKPHGALYNLAAQDADVAETVARAIAHYDGRLIVVTLPGSALALAARGLGLTVAHEAFADRAYTETRQLVPRGQPGAVIHDPDEVAARAVRMATRGEVETLTGTIIPLHIDTLCVHGDTPGAVEIATALCAALKDADVEIAPLALG